LKHGENKPEKHDEIKIKKDKFDLNQSLKNEVTNNVKCFTNQVFV